MDKLMGDLTDLLKTKLDLVNESIKKEPEEMELVYFEGVRMIYSGFLELIKSYSTSNVLQPDIEKRRSFLRFYANLYRGRWDKYAYDCGDNGAILKMYGERLYNKTRGRRDACSDLYHELKKILEVIPDAKYKNELQK